MFNMKNILIMGIISLSLVITAACSNGNESNEGVVEPEQDVYSSDEKTKEDSEVVTTKSGLLHLNTKNVTRLDSDDPIEVSVLTSQTIWPATHTENQPGTIMLAPLENWQLALASLNLVHHPNDGPLLFTKDGGIPELILGEIERLTPKGNVDGVQIMVLGQLNEGEIEKLADYEIQQITEVEPAAFAYEIDRLYSDLINHIPNSVIIGSMDEEAKEYSIPAGSWITHMDESILFVSENEVPAETSAALEKRDGQANIYVVGPEHIISNDVITILSEYGEVTRINGETPAQVSIEFAKFKDADTHFGWGITNPGHGLVMVSTDVPELAITAAPFAHLGKHAPMVWLEGGEFTEEMHEYLALLKPMFENDPTEGPYNHAYLIGSEQLVTWQTQGYIDEMLEIVPASGGGHGDHGGHGGHGH